MLDASLYVSPIEENQGIKIACLEEVAHRMGYMEKDVLRKRALKFKNNEYYKYALSMLDK